MTERLRACAVSSLVCLAFVTAAFSQETPPASVDPLHAPFDRLLDLYVRDGLVYYRALKSDRSSFDRYVSSLDVAADVVDGWSRERKLAYWVNAYNAFVIDTVLDRYPIRGRSPEYPANSLRQIPGAYDKIPHRAAGRTVTLDEIEARILAELGDPRAFLALGRGAVGGGRLVSAAYTAERVDAQLQQVVAECITRQECARLDASGRSLSVTAVFSWRQADFVKAFGQQEVAAYPGRSPIERAVLSLLAQHFLPGERLALRSNDFSVTFQPYDWRLNDLTGGPPPR